MLNSHIAAYVSRCFEESRRRHIEPGYLLLSTGRVFEVEREEWFSSYESYADRLGTVLAHMESGKAADYASEWLDLTPVELEEIRARFDD